MMLSTHAVRTDHDDRQAQEIHESWTIWIDGDGTPVAGAEVSVVSRRTTRVRLHVAGGHQPIGLREQLLDAVFDLPVCAPLADGPRRLEASLPIGDTALLTGIRSRCDSLSVRAAGASCLADAVLVQL
jgi:hypothetical protein